MGHVKRIMNVWVPAIFDSTIYTSSGGNEIKKKEKKDCHHLIIICFVSVPHHFSPL